MLGQIVIGSVRDTPQFAPTEGEQELDIGSSLTVEAQFLRRVITKSHLVFLDAKRQQPVTAEASPVLEPLHIGAGLAEELQLHLLELSGTESEVTGCDLITERLTNLSDTERNLLTGSSLYIFEVNENTLCSLGS